MNKFNCIQGNGGTSADKLNIVLGMNEEVPFANYKDGQPNLQTVNVKFFDPGSANGGKARMPIIIVEKDGKYQDFYWNGVFKMLSEESDPQEPFTPAQWWKEDDICVDCPDWFTEVTDLNLIKHS